MRRQFAYYRFCAQFEPPREPPYPNFERFGASLGAREGPKVGFGAQDGPPKSPRWAPTGQDGPLKPSRNRCSFYMKARCGRILLFIIFGLDSGHQLEWLLIDFTCGQSQRAPLWSKQHCSTSFYGERQRWLVTPSCRPGLTAHGAWIIVISTSQPIAPRGDSRHMQGLVTFLLSRSQDRINCT